MPLKSNLIHILMALGMLHLAGLTMDRMVNTVVLVSRRYITGVVWGQLFFSHDAI